MGDIFANFKSKTAVCKVVNKMFIFMFGSIVIEVGFSGITTSKIEAVGYIMYYIFVIFL